MCLTIPRVSLSHNPPCLTFAPVQRPTPPCTPSSHHSRRRTEARAARIGGEIGRDGEGEALGLSFLSLPVTVTSDGKARPPCTLVHGYIPRLCQQRKSVPLFPRIRAPPLTCIYYFPGHVSLCQLHASNSLENRSTSNTRIGLRFASLHSFDLRRLSIEIQYKALGYDKTKVFRSKHERFMLRGLATYMAGMLRIANAPEAINSFEVGLDIETFAASNSGPGAPYAFNNTPYFWIFLHPFIN